MPDKPVALDVINWRRIRRRENRWVYGNPQPRTNVQRAYGPELTEHLTKRYVKYAFHALSFVYVFVLFCVRMYLVVCKVMRVCPKATLEVAIQSNCRVVRVLLTKPAVAGTRCVYCSIDKTVLCAVLEKKALRTCASWEFIHKYIRNFTAARVLRVDFSCTATEGKIDIKVSTHENKYGSRDSVAFLDPQPIEIQFLRDCFLDMPALMHPKCEHHALTLAPRLGPASTILGATISGQQTVDFQL